MTSERDVAAIEALARDMGLFADPPPSGLVDRCGELFTWRTVDGELADLVADASMAGAGTRAEAGPAILTFESDGYLIEVDVVPGGGLAGHLAPPVGGVVRVETPGGTAEAPLDEAGGFRLPRMPAGPFRLVVAGESGEVLVRTQWTST